MDGIVLVLLFHGCGIVLVAFGFITHYYSGPPSGRSTAGTRQRLASAGRRNPASAERAHRVI